MPIDKKPRLKKHKHELDTTSCKEKLSALYDEMCELTDYAASSKPLDAFLVDLEYIQRHFVLIARQANIAAASLYAPIRTAKVDAENAKV